MAIPTAVAEGASSSPLGRLGRSLAGGWSSNGLYKVMIRFVSVGSCTYHTQHCVTSWQTVRRKTHILGSKPPAHRDLSPVDTEVTAQAWAHLVAFHGDHLQQIVTEG